MGVCHLDRCDAIGQSSAIEAATVVCLSEASPLHFEEMAPETLWQAHAEQLHTLSLADQAVVQPRRPPLATWQDLGRKKDSLLSLVASSLKSELMLSTTSRVSVRCTLCQDSEDTWINKWMLIEFVALFGLNVDDLTLKTCCPSVAIAVVLF